jgi:phosphatidylglycerophosphate synthase
LLATHLGNGCNRSVKQPANSSSVPDVRHNKRVITSRPTNPSVAQIKEVVWPAEIRGRQSSEHWLNEVYLRKLSPYQTRVLLKAGFSANGVTYLMIASGFAAGLALLIPGLPGGLLAAFFGQLQMLLDCSDGEVARWRQTSSPTGVFLDKLGHYMAEGFIPIALGIRAVGGVAELDSQNLGFVVLGLLLSVLVLFNKALNDMVHVARAFNDLPKLSESPAVASPKSSALAKLRSIVRLFPFNRIFHSIEMTLLIAIAAVSDIFVGELVATQLLLQFMVIAAAMTVAGHIVAILNSSRLR